MTKKQIFEEIVSRFGNVFTLPADFFYGKDVFPIEDVDMEISEKNGKISAYVTPILVDGSENEPKSVSLEHRELTDILGWLESEEEAGKMIVSGFVAPLIKKIPLEYAVEMNRLIDMEMEGSIG